MGLVTVVKDTPSPCEVTVSTQQHNKTMHLCLQGGSFVQVCYEQPFYNDVVRADVYRLL